MHRTGIAQLPLHYGKVPPWLFERMTKMAREITLIILDEFGPHEVLTRLSDPFWFQAFGCVLGFDWHSSGITTTVCGALKEGLKGLERDTGLFVAGGKGKVSLRTPLEIETTAQAYPLKTDARALIYASRMSAKVDNNALQDGYTIYHHCFIFTEKGSWTVIQQGMNPETHFARRYHWLGSKVQDFVCEPHSGICCDYKGKVIDLVAKESIEARKNIALLSTQNPDKTIKELERIQSLTLPREHHILVRDLDPKALRKILISTYERQPQDFKTLLGLPKVGPKTIRALALISELIYGTPISHKDPAKFSFAHGGKDGHPYPVDRKVYDRSIEILHKAISKARVGDREKLSALKRLSHFQV
ncbi:MAG TPA: DUF763 domain-containing protein [Syntrophaceae bacterium]|nr:DUF763 domain-containing protein [Syntrophaceae bacterium]